MLWSLHQSQRCSCVASRLLVFSSLHLMVIRCTNIPNMQEGVIAGLTDKGFGFIKIEGQEKDLFFHSNELIDVQFDSLRQGDKVSFETSDSPKGLNAVKVRKI